MDSPQSFEKLGHLDRMPLMIFEELPKFFAYRGVIDMLYRLQLGMHRIHIQFNQRVQFMGQF